MLRGIITGIAIGCVLTAGNLYMGLKTGWWDSGMISAAVLGFAFWHSVVRPTRRFTKEETLLTITTAASMAVMPTAIGLLGALPALQLLGHHVSPWMLGAWGLALGAFGISIAVWLRERFMTSPSLTFPSAEATLQLLDAAYVAGGKRDMGAQLQSLLSGSAVAAIVTWFRDGRPSFIPGTLWLSGQFRQLDFQSLTLGVSISPLLMGIGLLVGLKVGLSLLLGALIAWLGGATWAVEAGLAQPDTSSLGNWLTAPGVALLISGSLVPLLAEGRKLLLGLKSVLTRSSFSHEQPQSMLGVGVAAFVVVGLSWLFFDVHPAVGVAIVVASVVLIDVCVVSAGQSDILPLGAVGQFAQLALGVSIAQTPSASVGGASIASGAAAQTAQMTYIFKVAQHVATPQKLLLAAQATGVVAGTTLSVAMYQLLTQTYALGSPELPAPFVMGWKALAELTSSEGSPLSNPWLLGVCGVGAVLALLEKTPLGAWVPAPTALGLAFLLPASNSLAIALGSIVGALVCHKHPARQTLVVGAASGAIIGEGLLGVVLAFLNSQ